MGITDYDSFYDLFADMVRALRREVTLYDRRLKFSRCSKDECAIKRRGLTLLYSASGIDEYEKALGTLAIAVECDGEGQIKANPTGTIDFLSTDTMQFKLYGGISWNNYTPDLWLSLQDSYVSFRRTVTRTYGGTIILYAVVDNLEGACTKETYYKRSDMPIPDPYNGSLNSSIPQLQVASKTTYRQKFTNPTQTITVTANSGNLPSNHADLEVYSGNNGQIISPDYYSISGSNITFTFDPEENVDYSILWVRFSV